MIAGAELLPVLKPERPGSTNPANEVAKKLTGRDYVSWSAIATFRTCPLKYKFRYIDGLPEESVSAAHCGHLSSCSLPASAAWRANSAPRAMSVAVARRASGCKP